MSTSEVPESAPTAAAVAELLLARLRELGSLVVAFSGGVDSAVVLAAAVRALGPGAVLAAIADSPSLARAELAGARALAGRLGVELAVLRTEELADPGYRANTGDRCYFCKRTVLDAVGELARDRGMRQVATGTHLDDRRATHRPGLRAAAELGVHEPLAEVGATKIVVRQLATHWELPVRDKPSTPCLASRIAVGVPVSRERLALVERAELATRSFLAEHRIAVRDVRVRLLGREGFRVELDAAALGQLDAQLRTGLLARVVTAGPAGRGELAPYHSGSLSG